MWVIFKIVKNIETNLIERVTAVEYAASAADASKYQRLFELQLPTDLRNRVYFANQACVMFD